MGFTNRWCCSLPPGCRQALEQVGLQVVEVAAANPVVSEGAPIPGYHRQRPASAALTALEVALCTWPGLVDAGEHLLAVAQHREHRPTSGERIEVYLRNRPLTPEQDRSIMSA